jgi:uncharacterized protein involved in copper resistance
VIEVETDIKRELYSALSREGLTLKDWFLKSAQSYISHRTQMSLPLTSNAELHDEAHLISRPKNGL